MSIFASDISPAQVAEFWKQVPPPTRPSEYALDVYMQHLRRAKIRGERMALILGATPELRSLALREGFDVVFVDHDRLMIEAMTLLMDYSGVDETREIGIERDWLEIPEPPRSYGVIFGDGSFNHLTIKQMRHLLARLRMLLAPTGTICLRVMTYPKSRQQPSLARIFSNYRAAAHGEQNRMFRNLWIKLLFARGVYQKSSRTVSLSRLVNKLKTAQESDQISSKQFKIFAPFAEAFAWGSPTVPFRNEFLHMLREAGFRIKRIHTLGDPEHLDISRIYELRF